MLTTHDVPVPSVPVQLLATAVPPAPRVVPEWLLGAESIHVNDLPADALASLKVGLSD